MPGRLVNEGTSTASGGRVAAPPSGGDEASAAVVCQSLRKGFSRRRSATVSALDDLSLAINGGEFMVLLGPSGCGKTTLLRAIAGLEVPDSGAISMRGETVFSSERGIDVPAERRRLGMMFQSYALWPNMTAFRNVAYPLTCQKLGKKEIEEEVRTAFKLVGVPELADRYPGEMSGGQQQRVALARAVVGHRDIVLFDEPLSNVDAKVRQEVRVELLALQRQLGFAAVYVTHDQHEALSLADRVAVMSKGRLVQVGTPPEIYSSPATRFVANFVGPLNQLSGVVHSADAEWAWIDTEVGRVAGSCRLHRPEVGSEATVVVRPHRCRLHLDEPAADVRWRGHLASSAFVGHRTEYLVALETGGNSDVQFQVWGEDAEAPSAGSEVWVSASPENVLVLTE